MILTAKQIEELTRLAAKPRMWDSLDISSARNALPSLLMEREEFVEAMIEARRVIGGHGCAGPCEQCERIQARIEKLLAEPEAEHG